MKNSSKEEFKLFSDPLRFYNAMLDDIAKAKKYIYIETFKFANDSIGIKFRDLLIIKAKEGVEIKLLLDSWGSTAKEYFFNELINHSGEVRYFEKIKLNWDIFTKGHKRNHRKIMIIDDEIVYIGSANYTDYSLNWRESVLRIQNDLAIPFKNVFLQQYNIYNKYVFDKKSFLKNIRHKNFEIIRDLPSITIQNIKKRYIKLIKSAKKEILIATPYFLPSFIFRKALMEAAQKGITVKIFTSRHSDVQIVDVLRSKYLGILHKAGVKIFFYLPHNLHAKLILVDKRIFSIGSPNIDYRSFRYMHELCLIGRESCIIKQIIEHFSETEKYSMPFNYEIWEKRLLIQKIFEWLLVPLRYLL
ncbi:MAG TPA: phosphatidylserine/phosphatidylglycerophosphate/cardiolipin synthase family protein [Bacteroidales bacterium]|nr:phosphatidylserine/phosphatidylglycerophosphate/cardiolipin synthase family protein [Bacteroidales bacterium]